MLHKCAGVRYLSTFLVFVIFFTHFSRENLSYASTLVSVEPASIDLSNLAIPESIGQVEESRSGKSDKTVFVIQDAHGIPDAQRNIRRLIDFLQKKYRINLVGLEGSSQKIDARLFRNFPDQKVLRKVLDHYSNLGELPGGTAAAILNEFPSLYYGIENKEVYEQGIRLYLTAMENDPKSYSVLSQSMDALKTRKKKEYSKELLKIDQLLSLFQQDHGKFLEVLKALGLIKAPAKGTALSVLLKESAGDFNSHDIHLEITKYLQQIKPLLRFNSPEQARFNQKKQSFQTSEISAGKFLIYIQEISRKFKISKELPEKLKDVIAHYEAMRRIESAEALDEFEDYAKDVKNGLLRTPSQKALNAENHQLELLIALSQLQLTRKKWNELKEKKVEEPFRILLKPYFDFYQNAELRDSFLFKNLNRQMQRNRTDSSILVTGGFHSRGLIEQLKKEEISYVLLTPAVKEIPKKDEYRSHMNGNVSWRSYLQIENGKINFHDAFARALRDQLISKSFQKTDFVLKTWRDQIIRSLAREETVTRAGAYTDFLDERLQTSSQLRKPWLVKMDRFIEGLKKLNQNHPLTQRQVLNLLNTSYIPAVFASASVMTPGQVFNATILFPLANDVKNQGSRSEIRSDSAFWEKMLRGQVTREKPGIGDAKLYEAIRPIFSTFFKGLSADSAILDLGTGNGFVPSVAAEVSPRFKIVGMDSAVPEFRLIAPNIIYRTAPFEDLYNKPLPPDLSGPFNAVTSSFAWGYAQDKTEVLKAIYRMLAPGGKVLLIEHSEDSFVSVAQQKMAIEIPVAEKHMLLKSLREIFSASNSTTEAKHKVLTQWASSMTRAASEIQKDFQQAKLPGDVVYLAKISQIFSSALTKLKERSLNSSYVSTEIEKLEHLKQFTEYFMRAKPYFRDDQSIREIASASGFETHKVQKISSSDDKIIGWKIDLHKPAVSRSELRIKSYPLASNRSEIRTQHINGYGTKDNPIAPAIAAYFKLFFLKLNSRAKILDISPKNNIVPRTALEVSNQFQIKAIPNFGEIDSPESTGLPNSIDAVTSYFSIEHFNIPSTLKRIARVLREGGETLFVMSHEQSPMLKESRAALTEEERDNLINDDNLTKFKKWFQKAGFEILFMEKVHLQKEILGWAVRLRKVSSKTQQADTGKIDFSNISMALLKQAFTEPDLGLPNKDFRELILAVYRVRRRVNSAGRLKEELEIYKHGANVSHALKETLNDQLMNRMIEKFHFDNLPDDWKAKRWTDVSEAKRADSWGVAGSYEGIIPELDKFSAILPRRAQVLDAASGPGVSGRAIFNGRHDVGVTGFDFAHPSNGLLHTRYDFVQAGFKDFLGKLEGRRFEAATSIYGLEYAENRLEALQDLNRALVDRGLLFWVVHHQQSRIHRECTISQKEFHFLKSWGILDEYRQLLNRYLSASTDEDIKSAFNDFNKKWDMVDFILRNETEGERERLADFMENFQFMLTRIAEETPSSRKGKKEHYMKVLEQLIQHYEDKIDFVKLVLDGNPFFESQEQLRDLLELSGFQLESMKDLMDEGVSLGWIVRAEKRKDLKEEPVLKLKSLPSLRRMTELLTPFIENEPFRTKLSEDLVSNRYSIISKGRLKDFLVTYNVPEALKELWTDELINPIVDLFEFDYPASQRLRSIWETEVREVSPGFERGPAGEGTYEVIDPGIQNFAKTLPPNARVVDIAAGKLYAANEIIRQEPGIRVHAFDWAKQPAIKQSNITYYEANLNDFSSRLPGSYDGAVSVFGIEYADSLYKAFLELHKTMKDGAPFYFVMHHKDSVIEKTHRGIKASLDIIDEMHLFFNLRTAIFNFFIGEEAEQRVAFESYYKIAKEFTNRLYQLSPTTSKTIYELVTVIEKIYERMASLSGKKTSDQRKRLLAEFREIEERFYFAAAFTQLILDSDPFIRNQSDLTKLLERAGFSVTSIDNIKSSGDEPIAWVVQGRKREGLNRSELRRGLQAQRDDLKELTRSIVSWARQEYQGDLNRLSQLIIQQTTDVHQMEKFIRVLYATAQEISAQEDVVKQKRPGGFVFRSVREGLSAAYDQRVLGKAA